MVKLISHSKLGHGLMVFCNKCKKRQSNTNHCNHKDRWKYKTDFKIEGKRYAMVLQSDNYEDALQELFKIKDSVKNPKPSKILLLKIDYTILEGIDKYFQKVLCMNEFQINKPKSKDHQRECIRIVERFGESLEEVGIDLSATKLDSLSNEITKVFYSHLEKKYNINASASIDKHTRIMRHFFNFLKKVDMYSRSNYFKVIETRAIESNPISISDEEFKKVLGVLSVENGHTVARGGTRNQYYDWLADALVIGRYTGLRKNELYNLRWDHIFEKDGYKFFNVIDNKITAQKGTTIRKVVAITDELDEYLSFIKSKSDSPYVIDCNLKVSTFKDNLGRSFTHFFKVAYPNRKVKHFKHLRKSHVTELRSILGDKTYLASGHSGNRVIEQHYIDQLEAATKFARVTNQLRAEQLN